MSLDISYYRKMNNSYSSTETVSKKESEIYELKQHIAKTFSDSLDYHDETLKNTVKQRFVISYHKDENKKKITAFPNELLNIGDMIDCFELKWLITNINPDQQVYTKGTMQQCNYTLPFQNSTPTIIQEPCIVLSQSDSLSGEDTGNIITIPDTQRVVYVQYNDNTAKLVEGKRLFIDKLCAKPKVFKITKIDRIYYMQGINGLWKLTCDEDLTVGADDRPDLLIADYVTDTPSQPNTPSQAGSCEITYKTTPEIKYGGSGKTFTAVFKDTNGVVLTANIPVWTLDVPTECIGKIIIDSQSDMIMHITVINDSSLLNKTFTIHLTDTINTCYASQVVKVVSPV